MWCAHCHDIVVCRAFVHSTRRPNSAVNMHQHDIGIILKRILLDFQLQAHRLCRPAPCAGEVWRRAPRAAGRAARASRSARPPSLPGPEDCVAAAWQLRGSTSMVPHWWGAEGSTAVDTCRLLARLSSRLQAAALAANATSSQAPQLCRIHLALLPRRTRARACTHVSSCAA